MCYRGLPSKLFFCISPLWASLPLAHEGIIYATRYFHLSASPRKTKGIRVPSRIYAVLGSFFMAKAKNIVKPTHLDFISDGELLLSTHSRKNH